jgi:glycosyltransferase involved in cell wall biosynthesis
VSSEPRISVLIPTYNRASFLPGTLRSVFAQTVPVDEVILVDDGSTDNTEEVVVSLLAQNPPWGSRLHYLRQENQGKSVALNNALKVAKGEWIAFLDSDDTWMPDKLKWQFGALGQFPECGACFTESSRMEFQEARERSPERFPNNRAPLGRVQEPSWLFLGRWPGTYMQSVIVRGDVMRKCGEFDPRLRMEQDVDFLFRLGLITDFCYVELPLLQISRGPGRAVGLMTTFPDRSLQRLQARELRLRKWFLLVGRSRPDLRRTIRNELASYRSELANRLLMINDLSSSRQLLQKAIRECFEWRFLIKWVMVCTVPGLLRRFVGRRILRDRQGPGGIRPE